MARQGTGTSSYGAQVLQDIYLDTFTDALTDKVGVIHPLGRRGNLPEKHGRNVRFQFYSTPAAITTTVAAEGDDPADVNFTTTTAEANLEEFGAVTPYSRLLARTGMNGTIEEIVKLLGYQAGISVEVRTISVVDGTTVSVNAGVAMTADAMKEGMRTLDDAGAVTPPSVPNNMMCFIGSAEAIYDMFGEGTPTYMQARSRDVEGTFRTPLNNTVGDVYGAAIKMSQSIQRDTGTAPDDDMNLLIAADAFGVSDLDFDAAQPRVTVTAPENSPHVPARNRGTAAWLLYYISIIIDNNRVVKILSDATGT